MTTPGTARDGERTVDRVCGSDRPEVLVLMGSASDWGTMQHAHDILEAFDVPHLCRVTSAHRTPDDVRDAAQSANGRGVKVIVAGAGGAAHLPGMVAAWTRLPVLGVPVQSKALSGTDSLLSIVQMPRGVPVGTLAIGDAGAANAALLAVRILAVHDERLARALDTYARDQADAARSSVVPPGRGS